MGCVCGWGCHTASEPSVRQVLSWVSSDCDVSYHFQRPSLAWEPTPGSRILQALAGHLWERRAWPGLHILGGWHLVGVQTDRATLGFCEGKWGQCVKRRGSGLSMCEKHRQEGPRGLVTWSRHCWLCTGLTPVAAASGLASGSEAFLQRPVSRCCELHCAGVARGPPPSSPRAKRVGCAASSPHGHSQVWGNAQRWWGWVSDHSPQSSKKKACRTTSLGTKVKSMA